MFLISIKIVILLLTILHDIGSMKKMLITVCNFILPSLPPLMLKASILLSKNSRSKILITRIQQKSMYIFASRQKKIMTYLHRRNLIYIFFY